MNTELLETLTNVQYSTKEAAEIIGIEHGRLQNWMNKGLVQFQTIELGPRRLIRRFNGYDLIMLGAMLELVDEYGIDVADAGHVATCMRSSMALMLTEMEVGKGVKAIAPSYYALAGGKVHPCHGVESIQELRDRLRKKSFLVFDAVPAIYEALVKVLQEIGREVAEELVIRDSEQKLVIRKSEGLESTV